MFFNPGIRNYILIPVLVYKGNYCFIHKTGPRINNYILFRKIKQKISDYYIYNNQFGFLNGATLNLLILKIVLLYFDSSQIYLLQKFFETFSEWEWKFPVKLEELTQKSQSWNEESEINFRKNQYLSKYINYSNEERIRLEKHTNPIMVVLTLGYPEQNCSYNVNYSTRKIILKEFENGYLF
ncbi:unnamed protein product [Meloidogyne enterolobii]|uniref:Uncharacterized protein n=1 Tax=Meloidogyne enterolobii TaxID=390850 RepID=A0ACB0ZB14_MELEN